PECEAIYLQRLKKNRQKDKEESYTEWRIENTTGYINRMKKLFEDEGCEAVMSWSMEWPRMMIWTGEDVFAAAAESDAEMVSICFYPGQSASHQKTGEELKTVGEINYLDYCKQAYDEREWNGWMREKRFKDKARIVYEFETYHNQTSYMYPAMAKYFRSQGIQAAAMWTYILPGQAEYTAAAHNLNLKTTPNKAAAFIAAGEVMKSLPRYEPFSTTSKTADYFKNTAVSHDHGCSAYADEKSLIYSETMPEEFVEHLIPKNPKFERVIGRGSSPAASYNGSGLYFIEQTGEGEWSLEILPDAEFLFPHYLRNAHGGKAIELSTDKPHLFELKLPCFGNNPQVYRREDGQRERIKSTGARFEARPGKYSIKP
ncbi:MAG: hypothetical protein U9P12_02710, partial [Verrucomicrobiota bacterium]|nr:hypothetical protein [Verrucomicrobiota bacterium]